MGQEDPQGARLRAAGYTRVPGDDLNAAAGGGGGGAVVSLYALDAGAAGEGRGGGRSAVTGVRLVAESGLAQRRDGSWAASAEDAAKG